MTSRSSAGLRLWKVSPDIDSIHSPAMNNRKTGVAAGSGAPAGAGVAWDVIGASLHRTTLRSWRDNRRASARCHVHPCATSDSGRQGHTPRPDAGSAWGVAAQDFVRDDEPMDLVGAL